MMEGTRPASASARNQLTGTPIFSAIGASDSSKVSRIMHNVISLLFGVLRAQGTLSECVASEMCVLSEWGEKSRLTLLFWAV